MVSKAQSSNPLDQRHGNSVLSLLPRTFKESASDALTSKHSDDLDYIHHFMKSMALRSPDKLLEKAKTILDGCLEFPKTMFTSLAAHESKSEAVAAKGNENPQERRPGLGRKRTRFSLKPETSQPKMTLEPTFDINPLQNPEDFFEAYEKFENARKEIQRQKGGDMAGLEEVDLSMNARCRRPGISGKKVMYKHHQYSVCPEDDILSSEASQHDIPSPPKDGSEHETAVPFVESQEKESVGSILKPENKVNELFDELLSSNIESFDGDEAVSFLQDRLQIKPIDLENLCLPDFHDVNRADVVALEEKVPKRYTLSDVHNLLKGLRGETPVKQKSLPDSSIHLTSPTLLKSPLASISLLGKRISQSSSVSNPFSSHNNDIFPATSPVEILGRESDQVSTRMELSVSRKLESLAKDKAATMTVANDTHKVTRGDLTDKLVNNNPGELSLRVDVRGREFYGDLKDHGRCIDMDDNISGPNAETNVQTCKYNMVEENAEAVLLKAVSSAKPDVNMQGLTDMDAQRYGLHDIDRNVLDMQQKASSFELPDSNVEISEMESLDDDRNLLGQRNPSATKDHAVGGSSKTPESGPDQRNEEHPRVMRKELSKATRQGGGQRKDISHRQSLAGAGTVWKSGVRRSSRVKHRPLEYWKGERLLYGRVHNSLPTVIGLKYISPSKGEEGGTFKVKSYVSDQFKELVELAALH